MAIAAWPIRFHLNPLFDSLAADPAALAFDTTRFEPAFPPICPTQARHTITIGSAKRFQVEPFNLAPSGSVQQIAGGIQASRIRGVHR